MILIEDYIKSGNYTKKTYLGERGVANILLSSNINSEFSICLKDEQNGVKSSWEMIMCEDDAKKVASHLAEITGITSSPDTPQGNLADEVWKLYKKYQSHLATSVIEFGDELADLLGKYQEGGAE